MRNLTIGQAAAIASYLGIMLAVSVLIGTFVGLWLDGQFATGFPVFTILGALMGLVSGVGSMSRLIPRMTRPRKE